jgi:hypothetical protein
LILSLGGCAYFFPSCETIPDCPDAAGKLCTNLACSDLQTDPFNCGGCFNTCGAGLKCVHNAVDGGAYCGCTLSGQTFADARCFDLTLDPQNCGAVGNACRPDQICFDAGCACPASPYLDAGEVECTNDAGTSCADLSADPLNCGSCGVVCADACVRGACLSVGDGGPDAGTGG